MADGNHCVHCEQTESLEKDIRALFRRNGTLTTQLHALTTEVALQKRDQSHMTKGIDEIKEHLTRQDGILDKIKAQISRWLGAITAIMAIVGIILTVVQIFRT